MVLKVKLRGDGTPQNPYRVTLPTYNLLHGNVTHGYALVSVSDDSHGLTEDDLAKEEREETTEGPHYPNLSAALIDKIHAHMDKHYVQPAGTFRIETL